MEEFYDWPYFEQVKIEDNKIYLAACYYSGSAHLFSEEIFMMADLTKSDSIEKVKLFDTMKSFIVSNGVMVESKEGQPYKAYIDELGEYGYYDGIGKKIEVGKVPEDKIEKCECIEVVNGRVFFILNDELEKRPEGNVGWREAFSRKYTRILYGAIEQISENTIVEITN